MSFLTTLLPTCRFCSDPATRWRLPINAPWDLDNNYNEVREEHALEVWESNGPPAEVYGTCEDHFYYEWDDKGNAQLSVAGQHLTKRAKKGESVSRAQRQRRTRDQCRLDLIEILGGRCHRCEETDPDLLRILWADPRRRFGGTQLEWYRWILEKTSRLDKCTLECTTHTNVLQNDLRADAVAVYGGRCEVCETDEGPLWVVPGPDTVAPRYPGGKKMGSQDKLRWLAREGYPGGWVVRCPSHAQG